MAKREKSCTSKRAVIRAMSTSLSTSRVKSLGGAYAQAVLGRLSFAASLTALAGEIAPKEMRSRGSASARFRSKGIAADKWRDRFTGTTILPRSPSGRIMRLPNVPRKSRGGGLRFPFRSSALMCSSVERFPAICLYLRWIITVLKQSSITRLLTKPLRDPGDERQRWIVSKCPRRV